MRWWNTVIRIIDVDTLFEISAFPRPLLVTALPDVLSFSVTETLSPHLDEGTANGSLGHGTAEDNATSTPPSDIKPHASLCTLYTSRSASRSSQLACTHFDRIVIYHWLLDDVVREDGTL